MQYRTLRRVVLSFAAVIVAVGSLTLLGCGSDDEDTRAINVTLPLNATSANANSTAILNGQTFVVSGNTLANDTTAPALKAALTNTTPTLTFANISGANGTFTTTNPTTSGTVRFASCTFTVTAPANLAGTIVVQNCSVTVTGTANVGGDTQTGTMTLNLDGSTSSVTVTVQLDGNGVLLVNGTSTTITVTGTSGG